ncbi:MAG: quinolinate synthase NadA [Flavobacteriales bacterium]|jgi:quinolinate synthase|nr:quinolinate synthase NadA [Flavobacteriaceae bacterium]MDO7582501.1 quinolinate synthase NadA [Flavobacteriaceae bacterium]MDO7591752.1 quinolinate synthase NadA [Flavobacteriaceae bacterium]MDO7599177.1 quinolinate synthase NadA [Flavobacteriaceae bacterium]MDO7602737.1 quinolinate synthase NadA [Flavobacteriaceae bacterium]|tara:strand:+ start:351 stop:1352 length:1002 start_codon:yes stop_codon:yes gene_type:complete
MGNKIDLKTATSNLNIRGYLKLPVPRKEDLVSEIKRLKIEKNAVILAHYYQNKEIQELADYLGDSLYLAKVAAKAKAAIIVFAGVHFMAETAKIINPTKKVVLPDLKAGCSLADSCPPSDFKKFKEQYPDAIVVTYINCSADIKALSDVVCTSSNAVKVIESIPKDQQIIFAPDKNLGRYLIKETGRDMILWEGSCIVHEAFSFEKIVTLFKQHPNAKFIAHPESESQVLDVAQYVGSTSGLLNFIQEDSSTEYIVATEAGILYEMQKRAPHKTFIPAPVEDDTCACSECAFMKLNTLEKLYLCLEHELPEILLDEDLMRKARLPIERMLELG